MTNLLSIGLYQTADVARYLRATPGDLFVKPRDVRRWAFGYERQGKQFDPAIVTDLEKFGDRYTLTFLEFVELMYIKAMLETSLSWAKVREAARVIKRLIGVEHPFAMKNIFADPAGIYLELGREHGESLLVELAGDAQVAMREALEPYLKQLDFDVQGQAERWFPLGKGESVVLDPERSFGAPITVSGVRTSVVQSMHEAGDSPQAIADWFGVTLKEIADALEFERRLVA